MLKKLFYYDFRALGRTMIPTVLCTFGISVLASILFSVYYATDNTMLSSVLDMLVISAQGLLTMGLVFSFLSFYIIYLLRIRSHIYGDEGYLTLVLPANAHQHTLAKLFSGTLWGYIHSITLALSVLLTMFIPLLFSPEFSSSLGDPETTTAGLSAFLGVLEIVAPLVGIPSQLMLIFAAISVGSLLTPRARNLISILFYIGINTASQFLSGIIELLFFDPLLYYDEAYNLLNEEVYMLCTSLLGIAFSIVIGVLMYFLNVHLLKKKVNLE